MSFRLGLAALAFGLAAASFAEESPPAADAGTPEPAKTAEKIRAAVHLRDGGLVRGTVRKMRLGKSISLSLASYLPAATNGGIQNNYLAVLPQKINNDSTTNKVDLNLSDKNRVFDGVITLPAGNYVLRYRSDGTHSYNDWNTDPPDDPESWGIAVFRLARR